MENRNSKENITLLARKWQDCDVSECENEEFERWYHSFNHCFLAVRMDEDRNCIKARIFKGIEKNINLLKKDNRF